MSSSCLVATACDRLGWQASSISKVSCFVMGMCLCNLVANICIYSCCQSRVLVKSIVR